MSVKRTLSDCNTTANFEREHLPDKRVRWAPDVEERVGRVFAEKGKTIAVEFAPQIAEIADLKKTKPDLLRHIPTERLKENFQRLDFKAQHIYNNRPPDFLAVIISYLLEYQTLLKERGEEVDFKFKV
jgi:hypothetical protein